MNRNIYNDSNVQKLRKAGWFLLDKRLPCFLPYETHRRIGDSDQVPRRGASGVIP